MLNLYCDESCHLENDGFKVMLIGAISCPDYAKKEVYEDIRNIKQKHNIPSHREIKWSKVSDGEKDYYLSLVNYFFENELLTFRCVLLPDKSILRHGDYGQTHDDFYYKMYYYVITKYLNNIDALNIYVDIKDTQSIKKVRKLEEVLENKATNRYKSINKIQQVRSHENSILQLTDLLLGAVSYINRDLKNSNAKVFISQLIATEAGQDLKSTSPYTEQKFNILCLDQLK